MTSIKLKSLIFIFLFLFFNGFASQTPKIDTTTDITMKESIQKVKDNLQDDNQKKESKTTLIEKIQNWEAERDLSELKKLEEEKRLYEKSKVMLSQFKIIKSKFYKENRNEYGNHLSPIIELEVRNESKYPISRIFCKGTIKSHDRSVPWLVENFSYQISGGLEPNETRNWRLAPDIFSSWGSVNAPKDAIFDIEVLGVDGADGKELYSTRNFTEYDKERLANLKEKYK